MVNGVKMVSWLSVFNTAFLLRILQFWSGFPLSRSSWAIASGVMFGELIGFVSSPLIFERVCHPFLLLSVRSIPVIVSSHFACVSQNIRDIFQRRVYDHIPRSQHRPYGVAINPTVTPSEQPFRRRYNFKKANWETFTTTLDNGITSLASPSWKAYKSFSDLVRVCARKCIPRGCRTKYISGLTPESGELLKQYQELYDADPFSEDTIALFAITPLY